MMMVKNVSLVSAQAALDFAVPVLFAAAVVESLPDCAEPDPWVPEDV